MFAKNGYAYSRGGGECGPREAQFLRLWVNYDNEGIEENKAKHEGHRSEGRLKCAVRGGCRFLNVLEGGGGNACLENWLEG